MKELKNNKLDALITASLYKNVSRDAEAFLNLDVSEIKDDPRIKKRILSRAKNKRSASWLSAIRIAAIACLVIISMIFTACMCIPEVRDAMWEALVEWYDGHISVHFTQNNDNESDSVEEGSSADIHELPSSIEKRAVATYLPEGYYAEVNEICPLYIDTFYYDSEGDMKFRLMQTFLGEINEDDLIADNEKDPIKTIYINEYNGILVEYHDVSGLYYLVWQDKSYQYSLYGSFASVAELVKIAEGITTE